MNHLKVSSDASDGVLCLVPDVNGGICVNSTMAGCRLLRGWL